MLDYSVDERFVGEHPNYTELVEEMVDSDYQFYMHVLLWIVVDSRMRPEFRSQYAHELEERYATSSESERSWLIGLIAIPWPKHASFQDAPFVGKTRELFLKATQTHGQT